MGASAEKIKRTDGENLHESHKRRMRLYLFRKRGIFPNPKDKQNKAPCNTTLYDFPLELLDIILQKTYMHWILNSPANHRDEEVIRPLMSVDVCFHQRITRRRFKRELWRYLRDRYERCKKKHSAICRNNKDFLLTNIQPNEEFIDSLFSHNCITEKQSQFIKRQQSNKNKNVELLKVVRSFDDKQFTKFVMCLRQSDQMQVARVVKNGGVVIKMRVKHSGRVTAESMDTQLLNKRISDLRDGTKARSHQTDELGQLGLQNENIEILNSQLDRQTVTVVVWIWCRSQTALQYIEKMYESNQLRDLFFKNIQPSTSKMINIDIDRNQFKNSVVVCSIYINFQKRIEMLDDKRVCGVTKLRDEIYVLCRSHHNYPNAIICVFENQDPFDLQKRIKIDEMRCPVAIGSSEKKNCLYVHDYYCIWKITIETDYKYKIIEWITTGYKLMDSECILDRTLTVTSDGQLMVVSETSSILWIYGSNGKLIRSILLPEDIKKPTQAVETSIGNFVILHQTEYAEDERSGTNNIMVEKWGICELSRDGQMVIRGFIPSNEAQQLYGTRYISIDSDDRVFVADYGNNRVILLDSDLQWNRILLSGNAETKDMKIFAPTTLCYDAEKKQLIVVEFYANIKFFALFS